MVPSIMPAVFLCAGEQMHAVDVDSIMHVMLGPGWPPYERMWYWGVPTCAIAASARCDMYSSWILKLLPTSTTRNAPPDVRPRPPEVGTAAARLTPCLQLS